MEKKLRIGFYSGGIPNISPAEAFGLFKHHAVLIDIRPDYLVAFKKFDVENVLYIPRDNKAFNIKNLPKKHTYIVADTSTVESSGEIVKTMLMNGFSDTYNLAGGFELWERNGFPVITDKDQRLSGSCMCQLKPRERKR